MQTVREAGLLVKLRHPNVVTHPHATTRLTSYYAHDVNLKKKKKIKQMCDDVTLCFNVLLCFLTP